MPVRSRMSLRLPPDENASPAPVSTSAPTARSRLTSVTTASSASTMSDSEIELRVSGRFMVARTTAP